MTGFAPVLEPFGSRPIEDLSVQLSDSFDQNGTILLRVRGKDKAVECKTRDCTGSPGDRGSTLFTIERADRSVILGAFRDSQILLKIESVLPQRLAVGNVKLGTA